jgi:hypothetical protein
MDKRMNMNFNDLFKSVLKNISSFSALDMAIAMGLAFVVGLFIFYVYKKLTTGVCIGRDLVFRSSQCH